MTASAGRGPRILELGVEVVVLAALATVPFWALGWWTALPFATALGGIVGGRWIRWYGAPVAGFAGGAIPWAIELALIPVAPRVRLARALGPAEGLSGTAFILIGPILFGVVSAVTAAAAAGALRMASAWRTEPSPRPAEPMPDPVPVR